MIAHLASPWLRLSSPMTTRWGRTRRHPRHRPLAVQRRGLLPTARSSSGARPQSPRAGRSERADSRSQGAAPQPARSGGLAGRNEAMARRHRPPHHPGPGHPRSTGTGSGQRRRQGGAPTSARFPTVGSAQTADLRAELNHRCAGEDARISMEWARERRLNIKKPTPYAPPTLHLCKSYP